MGSTNKPQIRDYITKKQLERLVQVMYKKAEKGDSIMLKFIGEQCFGKAEQNVNLGNQGDNVFKIVIQDYNKQ